jgi:hypothetical protein
VESQIDAIDVLPRKHYNEGEMRALMSIGLMVGAAIITVTVLSVAASPGGNDRPDLPAAQSDLCEEIVRRYQGRFTPHITIGPDGISVAGQVVGCIYEGIGSCEEFRRRNPSGFCDSLKFETPRGDR